MLFSNNQPVTPQYAKAIENKPPFRKLRGYAFDPSLSLNLDTVGINTVTYKVNWESLEAGPIGEYIEVIDYDPSSKAIYRPVDLNDPFILAMDGLEPSESNPQFHQQMIYAVAMTTIKNFELALGRKIMWAPRKMKKTDGIDYEYLQRLRIYPHALREANAYYSPPKKSLLFGYFNAEPEDISQVMSGGIVFTCLSHDIIAHEMTHAILDGLHNKFIMPTNPDMLAFHEAFADIVALFQHFSFPEVLKHQISKTRGNLDSQNLLGQLAQEFGKSIGHYGALRDAIGEIDNDTKQWRLKKPDVREYDTLTEPHARGSILVAAVFDAFLAIYKNRIADLLRIATDGSGVLPEGELHPDLVNRLSIEAAKSANHVLRMCIRALDYCPPVDLTFGDFLRAIITADVDLVADDNRDYRLVFIDAFRRRGIYPNGLKTLSVDSLIYSLKNTNSSDSQILEHKFYVISEFLRKFKESIYYEVEREKIFDATESFITGKKKDSTQFIKGLHERIYDKFDNVKEFEMITGLCFSDNWEKIGIKTSHAHSMQGPSFEIHSLRVANRVGPEGKIINQIILSLIQKSNIVIDDKKEGLDKFIPKTHIEPDSNVNIEFLGGCTLIIDLDTLELKYVATKPLINVEALQHNLNTNNYEHLLDYQRLNEYYAFMTGKTESDYDLLFSDNETNTLVEPFAFLHRH